MYKRGNQGWLKHIDFILLDAIALQAAFILAYIIRHGFRSPYILASYRTLGITLIIVDILIAAIFNTMHNVLKRREFLKYVRFDASESIDSYMPREYLLPNYVSDCCRKVGFDGIKYYGGKNYCNYVTWRDGFYEFEEMM